MARAMGLASLNWFRLSLSGKGRKSGGNPPGRLKASVVTGDVRPMHRSRENAGALFQVASQFNLLEMVSPDVTPEHGVTGYQNDHTQGPACAIAAGAATIYRNYFAPIDGSQGQSTTRQFDGLADLGAALSHALKMRVGDLWKMRNGYGLCSQTGLDAIARHLETLGADRLDVLRGKLRIGMHRDVEVTEATGPDRPRVSQAFCSALPSLILECGLLIGNYSLTGPGGGVRGHAMGRGAERATRCVKCHFPDPSRRRRFRQSSELDLRRHQASPRIMMSFDLDVRLVSYGAPSKELLAIAEEFH